MSDACDIRNLIDQTHYIRDAKNDKPVITLIKWHKDVRFYHRFYSRLLGLPLFYAEPPSYFQACIIDVQWRNQWVGAHRGGNYCKIGGNKRLKERGKAEREENRLGK